MRTDANPRRECTCFFDIMWCVSAAQYYRISELLQEEQRRYGLMSGKLSEVTQKLSAAAEEYNRIDQEHQAQASTLQASFGLHSTTFSLPPAITSGRNVSDNDGSVAMFLTTRVSSCCHLSAKQYKSATAKLTRDVHCWVNIDLCAVTAATEGTWVYAEASTARLCSAHDAV